MVKENHEKFRETLLTFELHSRQPLSFRRDLWHGKFQFQIKNLSLYLSL